MKILHYYWTQFDDSFRKGGGIQVYLNNVIPYQVASGHEVYMLNSGVDYSILNKACYVKYIGESQGVKKFSIYNSPVLAPSKADFYGQKIYLTDQICKKVLKKWIQQEGPFDVIHFHTLEGLSLSVLTLKDDYPQTKFIYSVHNYFPFCPQVNLWAHDHENCQDFQHGKRCINCIGKLPNAKFIRQYYAIIGIMHAFGMSSYLKWTMNHAKYYYGKVKSSKADSDSDIAAESIDKLADQFAKFRLSNVNYFNKYIDRIICVSHRVQEICTQMGIDRRILQTLYIGTAVAANQYMEPSCNSDRQPFSIVYIGYMRRDKGFFFFLDAMEKMDSQLSKNISIVVAARKESDDAYERLMALKNKFAEITYYDGYTKDNIRSILSGVHLGVVPVMWEDNLPQVAMELKAMGIPVLASTFGGASELSTAKEFKFAGGNINAFLYKIRILHENKALLKKYFEKSWKLFTVQEHCEQLMSLYKDTFKSKSKNIR